MVFLPSADPRDIRANEGPEQVGSKSPRLRSSRKYLSRSRRSSGPRLRQSLRLEGSSQYVREQAPLKRYHRRRLWKRYPDLSPSVRGQGWLNPSQDPRWKNRPRERRRLRRECGVVHRGNAIRRPTTITTADKPLCVAWAESRREPARNRRGTMPDFVADALSLGVRENRARSNAHRSQVPNFKPRLIFCLHCSYCAIRPSSRTPRSRLGTARARPSCSSSSRALFLCGP